MGTFVLYSPIDQKTATKSWKGLKEWFRNNPDRTDCVTERGTIQRKTLKKDFLRQCEKGVKLK